MKPLLVTVASYTSPWEAHLAKGRLTAEGIQASIPHEHHVSLHWPISFALRGVRVQVHNSQVERACEVIQSVIRGDYEAPYRNDLEANPGGICPSCESNRIESRLPRSLVVLDFMVLLLFMVIFPIRRDQHECLACGNKWKY